MQFFIEWYAAWVRALFFPFLRPFECEAVEDSAFSLYPEGEEDEHYEVSYLVLPEEEEDNLYRGSD